MLKKPSVASRASRRVAGHRRLASRRWSDGDDEAVTGDLDALEDSTGRPVKWR
jgi:hypothetical protein